MAARTTEVRVADVRALCVAARSVANAVGIADELARSCGLSVPGVELALREHLEVDPSDAEVRSLVERAGDAPRVAVVLSANVFVGALRAIAIARAASSDVIVRPSRRDPFFAGALVRSVADPAIVLDESFDVGAFEGGEIHVYGHDATIAEIRSRVRAGVRVVGHGAGLGVVWISSRAELAEAAGAVARDVVVFDQRGCLSPRIVMVEGADARAEAFGEVLHRALAERARTIPRAPLPADVRAASERYIATMTYAGQALVGEEHVVGIAPSGAPLVPSPDYRHVHVVSIPSVDVAAAFIAPLAPSLVSFGSDDLDAAQRLAPAHARRAALGQMQKPPFDGPVDGRS